MCVYVCVCGFDWIRLIIIFALLINWSFFQSFWTNQNQNLKTSKQRSFWYNDFCVFYIYLYIIYVETKPLQRFRRKNRQWLWNEFFFNTIYPYLLISIFYPYTHYAYTIYLNIHSTNFKHIHNIFLTFTATKNEFGQFLNTFNKNQSSIKFDKKVLQKLYNWKLHIKIYRKETNQQHYLQTTQSPSKIVYPTVN